MGAELLEVIRLSALALAVTFMGTFLKKADADGAFNIISLIALIGIIFVVMQYVMRFFEALETMVAF